MDQQQPSLSFARVIILLVFAGAVVFFSSLAAYYFSYSKLSNQSSPQLTNFTPKQQSSLTETTVPIPPVTQTITQEVTIKPFTIKTGIDVNHQTQSPLYDLIPANGHYLLYVYETKKLIYDGREIYSGENLGDYTLSHNGLHYAYVVRNGDIENFYANTSNDLYIDDKKITSAVNLSGPKITDDGQHYFYITSDDGGRIGGNLLKDDKEIFRHDAGILGLWISGDGSRYFAELRNIDSNGNFVESLVRDGREIYKGSELSHKVFSDNGEHYAYIYADREINTQTDAYMQHLVVDGVAKYESISPDVYQITNSGNYAGKDIANRKVFVNDKEIPNKERVFINDDASHILVGNDEGWLLDGKPVQLPNVSDSSDIEMVGNTIFIYNLVR